MLRFYVRRCRLCACLASHMLMKQTQRMCVFQDVIHMHDALKVFFERNLTGNKITMSRDSVCEMELCLFEVRSSWRVTRHTSGRLQETQHSLTTH